MCMTRCIVGHVIMAEVRRTIAEPWEQLPPLSVASGDTALY